jgi:predicted MFS family arabinose efflux permease
MGKIIMNYCRRKRIDLVHFFTFVTANGAGIVVGAWFSHLWGYENTVMIGSAIWVPASLALAFRTPPTKKNSDSIA